MRPDHFLPYDSFAVSRLSEQRGKRDGKKGTASAGNTVMACGTPAPGKARAAQDARMTLRVRNDAQVPDVPS